MRTATLFVVERSEFHNKEFKRSGLIKEHHKAMELDRNILNEVVGLSPNFYPNTDSFFGYYTHRLVADFQNTGPWTSRTQLDCIERREWDKTRCVARKKVDIQWVHTNIMAPYCHVACALR